MILKTQLKQTIITIEDVTLTVQQLSTTALTEIAISSRDQGSPASMKATFIDCVVDWQGITDPEGFEVHCTPETKEAIYESNPKFVEEILTRINAGIETAIEAEKKI